MTDLLHFLFAGSQIFFQTSETSLQIQESSSNPQKIFNIVSRDTCASSQPASVRGFPRHFSAISELKHQTFWGATATSTRKMLLIAYDGKIMKNSWSNCLREHEQNAYSPTGEPNNNNTTTHLFIRLVHTLTLIKLKK